MDTEKRLGIKKSKAVFLFVQMILSILLLVVAIYLLIFSISNLLGGWMVVSYILVLISVLSIIGYGIIGYRKGDLAYSLAIIPFLGAVFANLLLPSRDPFQVAMLALLFAAGFGFLLRQKDTRFTYIVAFVMVGASLAFSIYSAIKANPQFVGDISTNWPTFIAMYASIFIPTIMSTTILLTYNVRTTRHLLEIRE